MNVGRCRVGADRVLKSTRTRTERSCAKKDLPSIAWGLHYPFGIVDNSVLYA